MYPVLSTDTEKRNHFRYYCNCQMRPGIKLGNSAPRRAYCEISRDMGARVIEKTGKRKRRMSFLVSEGRPGGTPLLRASAKWAFSYGNRRFPHRASRHIQTTVVNKLWVIEDVHCNVLGEVTTEVILHCSPQCRL